VDIVRTSSAKVQKPALTGSLFYLFVFLMSGALAPYLYVYFSQIGISGEQIGLLAIVQPVLTMLFLTIIASVADRYRKRVKIAQLAMVGAALSVFLMEFPKSYGGIAALVFSFAVFSTPIGTLTDGLVSRMAERHHLNFGSIRLWGSLMFALASVFFGALWQRFGFRPMFMTAALLYIPIILITGRIEEGPVVGVEQRQPVVKLFKDQGIVFLLVATFLSGISNSLFLTFGSVFASSIGASSLLIGLMIAFGCFAELPMMFYNARISKRLGKINTILLSYGFMAAAFLGYLLSKNAGILPVFTIMKGLGYGLWYTVTIRLLIDRTPEEWAATAQSLLTLCWFGLSPLVAGPLGGWIYDAISPAAVFGLAILSLVLASLVLIFAAARKKFA
jgi:MFS transporter, PPP family, 3-phenylpropionic acid transporter